MENDGVGILLLEGGRAQVDEGMFVGDALLPDLVAEPVELVEVRLQLLRERGGLGDGDLEGFEIVKVNNSLSRTPL
jgi:hypothetical protein